MDLQAQNGLMRTWREPLRARSPAAWIVAALLIGAYLVLYFTEWLTPLSEALGLKNKWFLYGGIYSLAMILGAVRYLRAHGNSRYNQVRIAVNVGVQVILAFLLPYFMVVLSGKDFYFSYLWPLKIDYLYPSTILSYPPLLVAWSVLGSLVLFPFLAIRYGKRFYCSWICGCGGLANTFGDPWRHLTDTSRRAWRFERVSVHLVLALAVLTTAAVGLSHLLGGSAPGLSALASKAQGAYGFFIGSILAGVLGTGLYPLLGPRVWCRNFCPMAAMLGLIQRFGRFRITVKEDMCISCGNCTAYCEMGIDVRAYAQENQSFTRASCVGCGMCAHVCPRGVLRLENRWSKAGPEGRAGYYVVEV